MPQTSDDDAELLVQAGVAVLQLKIGKCLRGHRVSLTGLVYSQQEAAMESLACVLGVPVMFVIFMVLLEILWAGLKEILPGHRSRP